MYGFNCMEWKGGKQKKIGLIMMNENQYLKQVPSINNNYNQKDLYVLYLKTKKKMT